MAFAQSPQPADPEANDALRRPQILRPADRHVLLGVSHASSDPARHRTFEILATYDIGAHGWVAHVGEQNLNEQRGDWAPLGGEDRPSSFPTAAACLGHAVASIVSAFDRDEDVGS
jgi:hypothetical protein